jgi:mitogen-activated protein kinase kinase
LNKKPENRPTYSDLLEHPFLSKYEDVDMKSWVTKAHEAYQERKQQKSNA